MMLTTVRIETLDDHGNITGSGTGFYFAPNSGKIKVRSKTPSLDQSKEEPLDDNKKPRMANHEAKEISNRVAA
jgi:hypothetical protein